MGARKPTDFCVAHGGGRRCASGGCKSGAAGTSVFCVSHGGGRRCASEGCPSGALGATYFCCKHGGGKRCVVKSAHVMDAVVPYAGFASRTLCWSCFAAIHPDLARSKVRKEHLVLSELERRCSDVFEQCGRTTWDCPVEGGCSLKRPDLALDFGSHVVVVEVDEAQHEAAPCWDEDSRLAVIAADFQKPIAVIRLRVDAPEPCFRRKRLGNGEPVWEAKEGSFALIMARAEAALRELAQRKPSAHDDVAVTQLWLTAGV